MHVLFSVDDEPSCDSVSIFLSHYNFPDGANEIYSVDPSASLRFTNLLSFKIGDVTHKPGSKHHNGMGYSMCRNPLNNELISVGDDKQLSSCHAKKILDLSHHCISTKWCSSIRTAWSPNNQSIVYAIYFSDNKHVHIKKLSNMLVYNQCKEKQKNQQNGERILTLYCVWIGTL